MDTPSSWRMWLLLLLCWGGTWCSSMSRMSWLRNEAVTVICQDAPRLHTRTTTSMFQMFSGSLIAKFIHLCLLWSKHMSVNCSWDARATSISETVTLRVRVSSYQLPFLSCTRFKSRHFFVHSAFTLCTKKLRGLSPRSNYTERATAAYRRS
jgi:hypothetical protein